MSGYSDLAKLENSRNCLRRIARHDEPQFSKNSIVNVMEKFVKTVNAMDETILVPCRLMDRQVGDSNDIISAPGKNSTANQLSSISNSKRNCSQSKNVHEFLNASELFNLYSMLNALKNDLLWTGKDKAIEEEEAQIMHYDETILSSEDSVTNDSITSRAAAAAAAAEVAVAVTSVTEPTTTTTTTTSSSTITETTTTVATPITESGSNVVNSGVSSKGHVRRPSNASVASIVSVSNLSDTESDSGMESDGNKCENLQSGSSVESMSSSSSENDVQAQKLANVDKATELAKRCRRHLNGLYQCLEQMTEAANYLTARYQSDIGGTV